MQRICLTVGTAETDVPGFTNTQIQAAVDRVFMAGGGTVMLSAGVFQMADRLCLRSNVRVVGQGEKTVLRKNATKSARITACLLCGHTNLILDKPDTFKLGEGVYLHSDDSHAERNSVATLVAREGDMWYVNKPHNWDYTDLAHGMAEALFPVVEGRDVDHAVVENLAIDGNAEENAPIDDEWGAGIYAKRANHLRVIGVTVRNGKFDGISWQTCDDVEVVDCLVEKVTGMGFHPGTGSNRFHMYRCTSRDNGRCGLYYCERARDSLLEDCVLERNGEAGVSTGDWDTGNINRRLLIRDNDGPGILIRSATRNSAAHNNLFEKCTLANNSRKKGAAEIVVGGETEGTRLIDNILSPAKGVPGILVQPEVLSLEMQNNVIKVDGAPPVVDKRGGEKAQ